MHLLTSATPAAGQRGDSGYRETLSAGTAAPALPTYRSPFPGQDEAPSVWRRIDSEKNDFLVKAFGAAQDSCLVACKKIKAGGWEEDQGLVRRTDRGTAGGAAAGGGVEMAARSHCLREVEVRWTHSLACIGANHDSDASSF
ncbi:hypothetical protein O3P69_003456 [Scylla paramamosain]|uniref:Uncharacterized protein n=1 Tax=Scylla paramamosain TaxID=85552 RepID=A0AAW0UGZ3_SCYPA